MGNRVSFFIYYRGFNRNYSKQKIFRFNATWYLLCCWAFSLCFIYRGSFCNYNGVKYVISGNYRINFKRNKNNNCFLIIIYESKSNLYPPPFYGFKWNTPSVQRLSWQLLFNTSIEIMRKLDKNFFFNPTNIYIFRKILGSSKNIT